MTVPSLHIAMFEFPVKRNYVLGNDILKYVILCCAVMVPHLCTLAIVSYNTTKYIYAGKKSKKEKPNII